MQKTNQNIEHVNSLDFKGLLKVDYYPYGKVLREYRYGDESRYMTTQHERDQETGLDYRGVRYYDSELGRFNSVDPWAKKYTGWSTYNYVMGNPVMLVDPTGRGPEDWVERANGVIEWDDNITSANDKDLKEGETWLGRNVLVTTHNRQGSGTGVTEDINSAMHEIYLESDKSGPSAVIYGNSISDDPMKYAVISEGLYKLVSQQRSKYVGIDSKDMRILNLDGTDGISTINNNPSKSNSGLARGIFFHRGNNYRSELHDSKGTPWSEGCITSCNKAGGNAAHNAFMKVVFGSNGKFDGNYYLRSKPKPVSVPQKNNIPVTVPTTNNGSSSSLLNDFYHWLNQTFPSDGLGI